LTASFIVAQLCLWDLRAARAKDPQRAERAAEIAGRFDFEIAMTGYGSLIRELSQQKPLDGGRLLA
jgi:hypothetical protein